MGRPRKYFTEEEQKAAKKGYNAKRYQRHRDEILAQNAEWRKNNPEYMTEWRKNNPEYNANYYQEHKDDIAEHYQENRDKILAKKAEWRLNNPEYDAEYRSTKKGRALNLLCAYRQADKKYNRGECTLTSDWIVDNVFSGQVCHYCGESDWQLLGVDRIDNTKPHTSENVVVCCTDCNKKKARTPYDEYTKIIGRIT